MEGVVVSRSTKTCAAPVPTISEPTRVSWAGTVLACECNLDLPEVGVVLCCNVDFSLAAPKLVYVGGGRPGRACLHGVHGGVAGDCTIGLMLAFVKLDVDGRLSIVCDLEHAILKVAPNRVHGAGVSAGWSWQWHHVMDWHSG